MIFNGEMSTAKHYRSIPTPRTIKLSDRIWRHAKESNHDVPMEQLVDDAVRFGLPDLIDELQRLGLCQEIVPNHLVRVPISEDVMSTIRRAKKVTGLPANLLLTLCIARHTGWV